ncbi:probable serine/threonine-protein kinase At1g54610 isoform X1 [Phragmites australis]|uniref:probable serine/threonine-protein kinase At1g54610 isoform X1 n=1 Tax=Phragmites australis TaxID=29695 RepID=UPI002D7766AF|nr:probable serine/threonine-protein kinase At1g54610 isoform X1 [Phragmites australis]
MGCVFGRAAAPSSSPPAAPRRGRSKEKSSPQPAAAAASAGSPSAAVEGDKGPSPGRPRRRLGGRRAAGPRQGCVPAPAAAEQLAAGWPPWLVAVAGEALRGWAPRRADTFEKLNKIGSGTYSNVYRARDTVTGRIVALKKVRFDNLEPESVKFMAREILILRRLNHPNVVKLEGLVTSRMSCSLYLVFEYMEHDLAGLAASPDVKFTLPQIKCYMQQLLSGLEHCHDNNVLHRDIKGSNLLLDNNGILKIADFGLATFFDPRHKRPMTSRVVTLWYRPPELLLGATDYGVSVDLWSSGCILAELLYGKPIMPGRTEVEQLHKIFKLCGSPSEEYWKKSKLPHATIFKPQQPYKRCIRETFKDFPPSSLPLVETLLAIDPAERQTATAALQSEFFSTEPYACDPSSLPTYPPSKEMDAKLRDEEARRLRAAAKAKGEVVKRTRPRDRSHRAGPAPEANAEFQANVDQRRRMITHANAKSKSEKFPPPHQDGAMGNPLGSCRHLEPTFEHQDASFSTVVPIQKGTSQTWSGPLIDPAALGQSRRKKQTALDAKAAAYSKQLQKEKGGIRGR